VRGQVGNLELRGRGHDGHEVAVDHIELVDAPVVEVHRQHPGGGAGFAAAAAAATATTAAAAAAVTTGEGRGGQPRAKDRDAGVLRAELRVVDEHHGRVLADVGIHGPDLSGLGGDEHRGRTAVAADVHEDLVRLTGDRDPGEGLVRVAQLVILRDERDPGGG